MFLDNGAFHKAKKLKVLGNIILIFLPPYSTELNSAEKMRAKIKRTFTNRLFKNLKEISTFIEEQVMALTLYDVKSICSYKYIFSDLTKD